MKPNEYKVLEHAVTKGITYGYSRAHKHTETPSDIAVMDAIHNAVMNSISKWFVFEDHNND